MNIAIITGASSGLGAEYARQLDKYNLDELWLIARREERMQTLSQSLSTKCRIISLDLSNINSSIEVISKILDEKKPSIKFTINNAGFGKLGDFSDLNIDDMTSMVDLNCKAVVMLSHLAIPYMKRGSALIHTSSTAGFGPLGGFAVYGATKSFVTSFSIALLTELESKGIHSIAVCPGPVETEFSQMAYKGSTRTDRVFDSTKKAKAYDVVKKALNDCKRRKPTSIYGFTFNILAKLATITPAYIVAKVSRNRIIKTPKGDKGN